MELKNDLEIGYHVFYKLKLTDLLCPLILSTS